MNKSTTNWEEYQDVKLIIDSITNDTKEVLVRGKLYKYEDVPPCYVSHIANPTQQSVFKRWINKIYTRKIIYWKNPEKARKRRRDIHKANPEASPPEPTSSSIWSDQYTSNPAIEPTHPAAIASSPLAPISDRGLAFDPVTAASFNKEINPLLPHTCFGDNHLF